MKYNISFTRGRHYQICCLFNKFSCSNADLHTISVSYLPCPTHSPIFAHSSDRHGTLILSANYYISASKLSFFFATNMVFCHSQVANMKIWAVPKSVRNPGLGLMGQCLSAWKALSISLGTRRSAGTIESMHFAAGY